MSVKPRAQHPRTEPFRRFGGSASSYVEAACKTLVAQRLKQSGMRWGMTGGQGVLTIRGWTQSERFDHAWALFAATQQIQVTLIDNVIAFPSRKTAR